VLIREELNTGISPGSEIPTVPLIINGTVAEAKGSAGWSHLLLFLGFVTAVAETSFGSFKALRISLVMVELSRGEREKRAKGCVMERIYS
jgi:hypothetical protein